jgi:hypothetical protein
VNLEIFDNVLDEKETIHIENFLKDPKFPWFLSNGYNHYTVDQTTFNKNFLETSGECILLTHTFYLDTLRNSDNYLLSDFVFDKFLKRTNIEFSKLFRSKANLQLSQATNKIHTTPHTDSLEKHKVVIYYANDSDGDTFFFDSSLKIVNRVTPKKGRFVMFDGNVLHAAGFNIDTDIRININFNFI